MPNSCLRNSSYHIQLGLGSSQTTQCPVILQHHLDDLGNSFTRVPNLWWYFGNGILPWNPHSSCWVGKLFSVLVFSFCPVDAVSSFWRPGCWVTFSPYPPDVAGLRSILTSGVHSALPRVSQSPVYHPMFSLWAWSSPTTTPATGFCCFLLIVTKCVPVPKHWM